MKFSNKEIGFCDYCYGKGSYYFHIMKQESISWHPTSMNANIKFEVGHKKCSYCNGTGKWNWKHLSDPDIGTVLRKCKQATIDFFLGIDPRSTYAG